ncbi:N-acetylmuramoyl-L-alanine amidase family protein, partial [Liquorilactobacillus ghanensis]
MGKNCKKDNKYKLAKVGKYVGSILFATVVTLGLTTQIQEIHADATTKTVSQSSSTVSSSTSTSSAATSSSVVNSSSSNNVTTAKSISSSDNSTAKTAAVQTKQNTDTKSAAASSDAESVAVTAATQTKQQTNAKAAKTAASVTLSAQSSSTADSATSKAEQSQATSSSAASSSSAATNADANTDSETNDMFNFNDVNYILHGGVTVKGVNKTALNEAMKNAYSKYNQAYNDTSEEDYYDGIDNLITILSKSAVLNRTLGISQGEADAMTAELQQAVNNLHLKKRKLDFSKFDKINSKIDSLYQDGNIVYLYSNSSVEPESAVIKYSDDSFRNLMYVSGNVSNEYEDYNSQSDIDSAVSKLTSAFNSLVTINEPVSMATITNAEKTYNDLFSDKVESELYDAGSILVDKDQTSEADINNYISAEDAYHKVDPGYGHEGESDYEGPVTFSKEKILAAVNQIVAATKKLKTPNTTNVQNLFEQAQDIQDTTTTLYEDTYKDFIALEQAAGTAVDFVGIDDMIQVWDHYYFDFHGFNGGGGVDELPYGNSGVTSQSYINTVAANLQKALTNYQQAVANHNKPANNTVNNQTNKNNQPATNNQTNKNNQPATNNQANKNNQPATNNQTNKNNQSTTNNQANKNNQPATNNQTNKNGQVKENGHWYLYKNGVKQTGMQTIPDQHKTVYYSSNGQMQYGQQKINGHWYLFDKATGAMKTGLQAIPEQHKTVYYNSNGQMQYGQQKINGHWYLFDKATG